MWTRRGILYESNMTYAHHILPKVYEHKLAQIGYAFSKHVGVCVRIRLKANALSVTTSDEKYCTMRDFPTYSICV